MGICAGAFLASSTFDWGLSLVNVESPTGSCYVPGCGYQLWLNRGRGLVRVTFTGAGREVLGSRKNECRMLFGGGPVFQPGRRTYLPEYVSLAYYASEVCQYDFQKGTMSGTPAIIMAPYGNGKVLLFSSHPESMRGLESVVWSAIRTVAQSRQ